MLDISRTEHGILSRNVLVRPARLSLERWKAAAALLAVSGSPGCGSDQKGEQLSYLAGETRDVHNAPTTRGVCPDRASPEETWIATWDTHDLETADAFFGVCGNAFIGWNDGTHGHIAKVLPTGLVDWTTDLTTDGLRADLLSLAPTNAGGVLASTRRGTAVLRADGRYDSALDPLFLSHLRFSELAPAGSHWYGANSGGVAEFWLPDGKLRAVLGTDASILDSSLTQLGVRQLLPANNGNVLVLMETALEPSSSDYTRSEDEDPAPQSPNQFRTLVHRVSGSSRTTVLDFETKNLPDRVFLGGTSTDALLAITLRESGDCVQSEVVGIDREWSLKLPPCSTLESLTPLSRGGLLLVSSQETPSGVSVSFSVLNGAGEIETSVESKVEFPFFSIHSVPLVAKLESSETHVLLVGLLVDDKTLWSSYFDLEFH